MYLETMGDILARLLADHQQRKWHLKVVIPPELKADFLYRLRPMNLTAVSLFPGIDGLGRSVAEYAYLECLQNIPHFRAYLAGKITTDEVVDRMMQVTGQYDIMPEAVLNQVLTCEHFRSRDGDNWVLHGTVLETLKKLGVVGF